MPYVIDKPEDKLIDALSDASSMAQRGKVYANLFDAIAETRNQHEEKGTSIKTPEWKLVARIPETLAGALDLLKEGGFISNKRGFYSWLDRNPQFCTYDRRKRVGG